MPDSIFNKVFKKEALSELFSHEFSEIFKNIFYTEHLLTTAFVNLRFNGQVSTFEYLMFIIGFFFCFIEDINITQFIWHHSSEKILLMSKEKMCLCYINAES